MLDDFFTRALLTGIVVALVAGPLGCFVVWRRMAYFGATISHSALLGVVLALLIGVHEILGVFVIGVLTAVALVLLRRRATLSSDSLLGLLAHATLALGLVVLALMPLVRIDLLAYLFGDILAVDRTDLAVATVGGAGVLLGLAAIWRPLLAGTVNADLAAAEGLHPQRAEMAFMILLAAAMAIAMKIVGILLITALLIIPAAAARRVAATPEGMAVLAAGIGVVAVLGGLWASLEIDTPSGPSIVMMAVLLFLLSLLPVSMRRSARPGTPPQPTEADR